MKSSDRPEITSEMIEAGKAALIEWEGALAHRPESILAEIVVSVFSAMDSCRGTPLRATDSMQTPQER